jgi:hypothetical protein
MEIHYATIIILQMCYKRAVLDYVLAALKYLFGVLFPKHATGVFF